MLSRAASLTLVSAMLLMTCMTAQSRPVRHGRHIATTVVEADRHAIDQPLLVSLPGDRYYNIYRDHGDWTDGAFPNVVLTGFYVGNGVNGTYSIDGSRQSGGPDHAEIYVWNHSPRLRLAVTDLLSGLADNSGSLTLSIYEVDPHADVENGYDPGIGGCTPPTITFGITPATHDHWSFHGNSGFGTSSFVFYTVWASAQHLRSSFQLYVWPTRICLGPSPILIDAFVFPTPLPSYSTYGRHVDLPDYPAIPVDTDLYFQSVLGFQSSSGAISVGSSPVTRFRLTAGPGGSDPNVSTIRLVAIDGVASPIPGDYSKAQDPRHGGRIFADSDWDAAGGPALLATLGSQTVRPRVEIQPGSGIVNPGGLRVRWEVLDPDDPASNRTHLDPNGRSGLDNTGTPHEGATTWFSAAQHALHFASDLTPVFDSDPIGTADTAVTREVGATSYTSSVVFHASDDGGDNFLIRCSLLDQGNVIASDQTLVPLEVWRYREVLDIATDDGTRTYQPLTTPAGLGRAYANSDPDRCAYLDVRRTQTGPVTAPGPFMSTDLNRVTHLASGVHANGRYTMLGVHEIDGPPNTGHSNTGTYPHAAVAIGYIETLRNGEILKTNVGIHELGHLLVGRCDGAACFHNAHSGPDCNFRQGSSTKSICAEHISRLRDRLTLGTINDHSSLSVAYDSSESPDRQYTRCSLGCR